MAETSGNGRKSRSNSKVRESAVTILRRLSSKSSSSSSSSLSLNVLLPVIPKCEACSREVSELKKKVADLETKLRIKSEAERELVEVNGGLLRDTRILEVRLGDEKQSHEAELAEIQDQLRVAEESACTKWKVEEGFLRKMINKLETTLDEERQAHLERIASHKEDLQKVSATEETLSKENEELKAQKQNLTEEKEKLEKVQDEMKILQNKRLLERERYRDELHKLSLELTDERGARERNVELQEQLKSAISDKDRYEVQLQQVQADRDLTQSQQEEQLHKHLRGLEKMKQHTKALTSQLKDAKVALEDYKRQNEDLKKKMGILSWLPSPFRKSP